MRTLSLAPQRSIIINSKASSEENIACRMHIYRIGYFYLCRNVLDE